MYNVTFNDQKCGIEIRFDGKPDAELLSGLRDTGFKWSRYQNMWYAKQTAERIQWVAETLPNSQTLISDTPVQPRLFEATRTDAIGSNVEPGLSVKEIAKRIRSHMRVRFPMCKFSVRVGGSTWSDSINIAILSSPFAKGSDELNAIAEYFEKYTNSFKYDTFPADPYSDYGADQNFYGGYCPVSYDYKQTEMTDDMILIAENFQKDKAAYEAEEYEREQVRLKEWRKEQEKRQAEYEAEEARRKANHENVMRSVVVKDLDKPYFLHNLIEPRIRKEDSLSEYCSDVENLKEKLNMVTCSISREIYMDKAVYEIFTNQLMDDWEFVAGKGGSATEDWRVNSMEDYHAMTEDERKTVEWYCHDCIAIYCDSIRMIVIDPQGYNYCRYVYFVCAQTKETATYSAPQQITKKQKDEFAALAEMLEDASVEIIVSNEWGATGSNRYYEERFQEYKREILNWVDEHNFPLSENVIRAVRAEMKTFKATMRKILQEYRGHGVSTRRHGGVMT